LIDGHSFCYRAFYAIRELTNSKGEPTNAIYGFITMLRKLLREEKPDYIAICFDRKEPTFRRERFADYKAHRKPMPDDLISQMPHIKDFVHASRISIFEKAGYEADDLLGTIAKKAEKEGLNVLIVTGDKDALQLVDEKVKIFNTYKEEVLDRKNVEERFGGLGPERVVDVMSLAGDASDNIPGVPGIGEKTAVDLIREYGSLDELYQNLNRIKGARKKALEENEQIARLSKDLATIDCYVPLEIDFEKMTLKSPDENRLAELFRHFEFRSLLKELTPAGEAGDEDRKYHLVNTLEALEKLVEKLGKAKAIAVDTETTSTEPNRAHIVGVSFSMKSKEAYYIPVSSEHHKGAGLAWSKIKKAITPILENEKIAKYGQNIKYDLIVLKRHNIELRGIAFDTMIASYLINPVKFNHNLDDITFEYLGLKKIDIGSLIGSGKKQISMAEVPLEQISEYACEDADCVFRLVETFQKLLEVHQLTGLFETLEMLLLKVLAQMEMNGVAIDYEFLGKLSEKLGRDLDRLTSEIYKEAGEEFNINSTKQLSNILFDKLKLPALKKTKKGATSTDAGVLEHLAQDYEFPKLLLEYREKAKLKSTYVDALPDLIDPETKVIHTSFNQTTTATGRLSSSEPNLQNIPIKTDIGREIRRAFVPRAAGRKILSADYSQVELRVLAHFSGDPNLVQAFQEDLDVHQFTATLLYNTTLESVTREMRNVAKTINFSIVYGVSAFGLAQSLGIPVSEAQAFIDSYFTRYSKVKEYLDAQKEEARRHGFLKTILGRRSYFPEINSNNLNRRQFAERAAINAPIQGSAADIIKLTMIEIQNELDHKKMKSLMIIQVHDELVFDVVSNELEDLKALVRTKMESAYQLRVPLKVDITVGTSWYKE